MVLIRQLLENQSSKIPHLDYFVCAFWFGALLLRSFKKFHRKTSRFDSYLFGNAATMLIGDLVIASLTNYNFWLLLERLKVIIFDTDHAKVKVFQWSKSN